MASFNKVILVGNLVETPELKQTPSGVLVTSFRIAVSRRFNKEGQQEADFINIVCWRSTAEFVTKYFTKGRSILVCGQLQSRNWTDDDGNRHYIVEVVADEVSFVDKNPDSQSGFSNNNVSQTPSNTVIPNVVSEDDFVVVAPDEDLPF